MTWRPLNITKEDMQNVGEAFGKKARFLIDESLDGELTLYLRKKGWNVKGVKEVGLGGQEDMPVLSFAWKEKRIVITNDSKFPDGRGFIEQGNPGIIVLPNAPLDSNKFGMALGNALQIVGKLASAYEKTKIRFFYNNTIEMIQRAKTGQIEKIKYRLDDDGGVSEWID